MQKSYNDCELLDDFDSFLEKIKSNYIFQENQNHDVDFINEMDKIYNKFKYDIFTYSSHKVNLQHNVSSSAPSIDETNSLIKQTSKERSHRNEQSTSCAIIFCDTLCDILLIILAIFTLGISRIWLQFKKDNESKSLIRYLISCDCDGICDDEDF